MMTNTSIFSSFGGGGTTGAKRGAENSHGGTLPDTALIMDECDGMSSGDRGGLQAPLIALSIPSTCVLAGGCVYVCSSCLRKIKWRGLRRSVSDRPRRVCVLFD